MRTRDALWRERMEPALTVLVELFVSAQDGSTTFRPESTGTECFLASDGRPLSYAGLKQINGQLSGKSGVTRLHLHPFRHTFAVKHLMNGGDLITLQRILGHTT
jgi:site-specific recombinase XerD